MRRSAHKYHELERTAKVSAGADISPALFQGISGIGVTFLCQLCMVAAKTRPNQPPLKPTQCRAPKHQRHLIDFDGCTNKQLRGELLRRKSLWCDHLRRNRFGECETRCAL